ncbi:alpha/beta fold hydrolase [Thiohalorhabdus sp.]|uniref:alpha/beta fold hydrolase n=1 Tax=Thiohalorhabdus sp. TaxID=3094134 RepID=UPI002FC389DE
MAGWGHTAACWERLMIPGAEVEGLSLPGHEPEGLEDPGCTLETAAEALTGDWDVVVGWSLGGLAAMEAQRVGLIRCRGLVLIGTPPSFVARASYPQGQDPVVLEDFRAGMADNPTATLRRFFALQFRGDQAPRSMWAPTPIRNRLLATGAGPEILAGWLDVLAGTDLTRDPPLLDLPVLVIHGEADAVVDPGAVRFFQDLGPQVSVHIVSGSGHAPHISHAQEAEQRIGEFVRTLA